MERNNNLLTAPILISLLAVYVLWGTTYLAIKILSVNVPLLLMATGRQLIAGLFMIGWGAVSGHRWPNGTEIKNALIVGFFLLVIGNASVLWANYYLHSSGVVAVVVATTPFWLTLMEWVWMKDHKPSWFVWLGVALGMYGIFMLTGTENLSNLGKTSLIGIYIIIFGTFSWSLGTLFSRINKMPESSFFSSGIQMLGSCVVLGQVSFWTGEWERFDLSSYGIKEFLSFGYLVIGGSILGFTAFTYLAKHTRPSITATYAYINPVIALFAGYWLGHETFTDTTIWASIILLISVAIIVSKPDEWYKNRLTQRKKHE